MGMFDPGGSLLQGALQWFGAEQQNRRASDAADRANDFSAHQFATRYQTTVADMQAAGLNPMLAYSQGGGSPPSGVAANVPANSGASFSSGYMAGRVNDAQVDLIKAQADAASAQAAKTRAETEWVDPLSGADVELKGSSAAANAASVRLADQNVQKIIAEIPKLNAETLNAYEQKHVLFNTAQMLLDQANLMIEQGKTQRMVRLQTEATIAKLSKETELLNFDVKAAADMGNIGREAGQLKPFIEMLMTIIRNAKR